MGISHRNGGRTRHFDWGRHETTPGWSATRKLSSKEIRPPVNLKFVGNSRITREAGHRRSAKYLLPCHRKSNSSSTQPNSLHLPLGLMFRSRVPLFRGTQTVYPFHLNFLYRRASCNLTEQP
jgi:hypothetical protein